MNARSTALLAFLQAVVIYLGSLMIMGMLKATGYPDAADHYRYSPVAVFLRSYFPVLFLVPLLWTCCVGYLNYRGIFEGGVLSFSGVVVLILLAVFLAACFFTAAIPR